MKHLAFLTILLAQCSPVPVAAIEVTDGKVILTPAEWRNMRACESLGGCFVVTRAGLDAMIEKTIELTLIEVAKTAPVCKRETI